jgi:hypothetical protein
MKMGVKVMLILFLMSLTCALSITENYKMFERFNLLL